MTGTDIIQNVTNGFSTFLTGTGDAIATFFEKIFTNAEGEISVMAIVTLSLIGLGFATFIVKKLLNKVA